MDPGKKPTNAENDEFESLLEGLNLDFDLGAGDFNAILDLDTAAPGSKAPAAETIGIGTRLRISTKAAKRRFYDLSRVPNAVALLGDLPKPAETVHAIMGGDFHAWDLVPAIQSMLKAPVHLVLTTLGFNLANNGNLCDLIDAGTVKSATIVCSEFFAKASPEVYAVAEEKLKARGQRIIATRNHSKIILLRTDGAARSRMHLVVEGSANLRSCNNVEQIALTNDRRLYNFHLRWIERLFAA